MGGRIQSDSGNHELPVTSHEGQLLLKGVARQTTSQDTPLKMHIETILKVLCVFVFSVLIIIIWEILTISNIPRDYHKCSTNHCMQATSSIMVQRVQEQFKYKEFLIPPTQPLNCSKIFSQDENYIENVYHGLNQTTDKIFDSDKNFTASLVSNCSLTFNDFSNSFYVSKIEKHFPLAFEMLIYYKPLRIQQYIRLLKNIYRPQNVYCIHIDKKAPQWWSQSLKDIANCFPNVIIARNPLDVIYASSRILYAHFKCFQELLESTHEWKYVISLHGTEIPLVTNKQMVEVLQKMNGSNIIDKGVEAVKHNTYNTWLIHKAVLVNNITVRITKEQLGAIPYNISVYKTAASANSAFSKEFINFMFSDKRAIAFAEYLKYVKTAVEFYFSTINLLPDAPGGLHTLPLRFKMPLIAQRDWMYSESNLKGYCEDHQIVHKMCIVSIRDLPRLKRASENMSWWFHNKYFVEYDHVVMDCMENLLLQRNWMEYKMDFL